jgi:YtcA family
MRPSGAIVLASMFVSGCSRSPSLNLLGAYFPDWMFCILAGVLLTILFHLIAQRTHIGRWFGPAALVYPALVTLLALVVWLLFFQH